MTFEIGFLLSLIVLLLFAIVVLILAYPGPVDDAPKSAGRKPRRHPRRLRPK